MQRVHEVTTIGLMFALPPLGGYWLDKQWGTKPWLLLVGVGLGFVAGMYRLFKLAGSLSGRQDSETSEKEDSGR